MELKKVSLEENENIKVHGRTIEDRNPVKLMWTGSAIEMNVKCSELYVEIESCYEEYENWISIMINGAFMARQMLKKEKEWSTGLDIGTIMILAGVICSLIDKLFWKGSLDYILFFSKIVGLYPLSAR